MKIIKTFFGGKVKLIKIHRFIDSRGFFFENFNQSKLKKLKINHSFVQDNFSYSKKKGVIRGLHFQTPPKAQAKLISIIKGKILDVVVDLRNNSKTYGKYEKIILNEGDFFNIFIPEGFAHGFSVLKDNTLVLYKTSNFYSSKYEKTINYNDEYLNIDWEINEKKTLSLKDRRGIKFKKFKSPFYL
tara:strand:- start:47 stop:604 length:558 start_codon:yes stop_codon:yes gene_type:complete